MGPNACARRSLAVEETPHHALEQAAARVARTFTPRVAHLARRSVAAAAAAAAGGGGAAASAATTARAVAEQATAAAVATVSPIQATVDEIASRTAEVLDLCGDDGDGAAAAPTADPSSLNLQMEGLSVGDDGPGESTP